LQAVVGSLASCIEFDISPLLLGKGFAFLASTLCLQLVSSRYWSFTQDGRLWFGYSEAVRL
jgi:hypothetical protein